MQTRTPEKVGFGDGEDDSTADVEMYLQGIDVTLSIGEQGETPAPSIAETRNFTPDMAQYTGYSAVGLYMASGAEAAGNYLG